MFGRDVSFVRFFFGGGGEVLFSLSAVLNSVHGLVSSPKRRAKLEHKDGS